MSAGVAQQLTTLSGGDVVGGKYVIDRALGEGGMGAVYLAHHAVTGRRVALKWVPTSEATLRERVIREARSMGRLSHPNVVGVLDVDEYQGAVYTVMEYVEGKDLRSYVGDRAVPYREAIDLMMPVLGGIAAAHQAGILHRDLKPENLFVCIDRDGTAFDTKVLDFGIAKRMGDRETALTTSGTLIGTPMYMAPEQITDGNDVDERMDEYALALILYELLAGGLPYKNSGLKTLVVEILAGQIQPLHERAPKVPRSLCHVIMTALASDRDARYPDVTAFAEALEPFAGRRRFERPRQVHTPQNSQRPPKPRASVPRASAAGAPATSTDAQTRPRAAPRNEARAPQVSGSVSRSVAQGEAPRSRMLLVGGVVAVVLLCAALGAWLMLRAPAAGRGSSLTAISAPPPPPAAPLAPSTAPAAAPSSATAAAPGVPSAPSAATPQPTTTAEPTAGEAAPSLTAEPASTANPTDADEAKSHAHKHGHRTRAADEASSSSTAAQAVKTRAGTLRSQDF